ncbi:DUF4438 domain-containing protein [Desulfopila aestuarii]|uniref:DUF4438 domain-containing protein n=1 Tax=Desulfopila aestuarii DSM 18488 TaxID=1121416 RepID=A0A1M7YAK0_9BACT|nr:DUF4438 domain-containing protein [Desulfopila aestuarii]SHO49662.1 protein of unknown function [Desulfopila aestuarii DSM 18488]
MSLKTNRDKIVEMLLQCQPGQPRTRGTFQVDHNGVPFILPAIGGITLNVLVGDSVFGLAGDHIEPGVSCNSNTEKRLEFPNDSLQMYGCVGNKAMLVSGKAEGTEGVVTGKHGGSEHLMIDFPVAAMEKMTYDDKIIVYSRGQGLALTDYPEIKLFNLDPDLLQKMAIKEQGGKLQVPVTTLAPAVCMGSGVGSPHVATGDYDIMTSDPETVAEYKLDKIRFGDIVALLDHDNAYGRAYKKGAVSIGVVVHSDCLKAGHGPGVTTIMTCTSGQIEPVIDPAANIAGLLKIGRMRL